MARFLKHVSSPLLLVPILAGGLALGCDGTLTGGSQAGGLNGPGGSDWKPDDGPAELPTLPGFSVIRRLNHAEYQNTVEDLLGTQLPVTESFPADDLGGEFATVGTALSLSPLYVMSYERAAYELADDLLNSTEPRKAELISCDVETGEAENCIEEIIAPLARRAFRRPLEEGELTALLGPYRTAIELGATKTEGLRHTLAALLLSPHFLFKVEKDAQPDSGEVRTLNAHEVATRLSYALWATMPDDELSALADQGALLDETVIEGQIERLITDDRAQGFLDNFASYWLKYARLESHEVEPKAFPDYVPELAVSMKDEANLFISDFLRADRPVREMLSADFTFLDERLAAHYGISRPADAPAGEFAKVSTEGAERGGLLTLGALLMTTSFSSRTSVVVRGAYVFDRLLCGEIPPPPPGVEGLEFDTAGLTQRERLDLHRQDPSCNSCHAVMDQLGFGLENYDAIGAYRELDDGLPVDATGELPDQGSFSGGVELGQILSGDPRFSECVTQKFMTYALGRLVSHKDPWLHYLAEQMDPETTSLSGILRRVLLSDAFLQRQAGPVPE